MSTVKPLYISSSLTELNKIAEVKFDAKANANVYIKSIDNLYKNANIAWDVKDEERAYVLYMKYLSIIQWIRKTAEFKKNQQYFADLIGSKGPIDALARAETLCKSLKERYDEKEAEELSKKLDSIGLEKKEAANENKSTASKDVKETDVANVKPAEPVVSVSPNVQTNGLITVASLYRLMIQQPAQSLLIFDVRSLKDYEESHMKHEQCVNVPAEILLPGSVVQSLEQKLPEATRPLWHQRSTADHIVLVDWTGSSSDLQNLTGAKILKDAIYKWELTKRLKCEPLLLEGGYEDWLLTYPTLTTNSNVSHQKTVQQPVTSKNSLDRIDFDVHLTFLKPVPEKKVETVSNHYPSIGSVPINNVTSNGSEPVPVMSGSSTLPTVIPNATEKRLISGLPMVDRSTKPSISKTDGQTVLNDSLDGQYLRQQLANKVSDDLTNHNSDLTNRNSIKEVKSGRYISQDELIKVEEELEHIQQIKNKEVRDIADLMRKKRKIEEELKIVQNQVDEITTQSNEVTKLSSNNTSEIMKMEEELQKLRELSKEESRKVANLLRVRRKIEDAMGNEEKSQIQDVDPNDESKMDNKEPPKSSKSIESFEVNKKTVISNVNPSSTNIPTNIGNVSSSLPSTGGNNSITLPTSSSNEQSERGSGLSNGSFPLVTSNSSLPSVSPSISVPLVSANVSLPSVSSSGSNGSLLPVASNGMPTSSLTSTMSLSAKPSASSSIASQSVGNKLASLSHINVGPVNQPGANVPIAVSQPSASVPITVGQPSASVPIKFNTTMKPSDPPAGNGTRTDTANRIAEVSNHVTGMSYADVSLDQGIAGTAKSVQSASNSQLTTQHRTLMQQPQPTSATNLLLPGWEKKLDKSTGRYFYIDHNTETTHWDPPSAVSQKNSQDVYKTKLKEEGSETRQSSGGLKRSHSFSNIAKEIQNETKLEKQQPPVNVNRALKPRLEVAPVASRSARVRDFQPVWGSMGGGLTGLKNLGNTCYMNSTIQCLSNTIPLTSYFVRDTYLADINKENFLGKGGEIAEEFAALIKALWCEQYKSIAPRDFKSTVARYHELFAGYSQQDSQEFLLFLMDGLHEDLNKIKHRVRLQEQNNDDLPDSVAADMAWKQHKLLNESVIVELFQGQFKSTITCLTCSKKSVTFDAFMYLTLPIPSNSSRCTLRDCLLHFAKEEKMTDSSRWACPRCKVKRDAVKQLLVWKLPRILLIHLKRFSNQGIWREKITTDVNFPIDNLEMSAHVAGPKNLPLYSLYAVSNHYGTMEGGHYTAYCRNVNNNRWYKYDDHEVYEMNKSDVQSSAAYILFYTSLKPSASSNL